MRVDIGVVLSLCLAINVRAYEYTLGEALEQRAAPNIEPPACSLNCISTLVPEYCGSLTNTTCLCTNAALAAVLAPCATAACNITDSLELERYQAEVCDTKNNKYRYYEQIRVNSAMVALSLLFVGLRIFTRIRFDIGLGSDDWMLLAAEGAYLTTTGTVCTMLKQGFGQHTFWLSVAKVTKALKFFYLSEVFYLWAITLTKLSLLLFFRRIFPGTRLRVAGILVGVFVVLTNFSLFMALCLQCIPVYGAWTNWMYKVPPVKCINLYALVYVAAGMSIFHDLLILCLPIRTLWGLNLHWRKKFNLLVMFCVGIFVIICSALRLPSLAKLSHTSDPSYDQAPIAIWTVLEMSIGIICACLPTCRSLVGFIFPALKMSLNPSNNGRKVMERAVPPNRNSNLQFRGKKGILPSTRILTDLDDRSEKDSQDELKGKGMGGMKDRNITLVPDLAKGLGHSAVVGTGRDGKKPSLDDGPRKETESGNSIIMTRTLDITR